ncbi:uncharacterized protein LODBEIA_P18670 [Lodderomyces beijingensis]|uniref:3-ketodihydrosphingosine reductase TSC10 n=1 Tax=Lodderomyces beijingensis TaxID=1775926 RepID=A0ABP0ZHL4_9ASCO
MQSKGMPRASVPTSTQILQFKYHNRNRHNLHNQNLNHKASADSSKFAMWFSKSNFEVKGKTAIIVGASQGLGVELAKQLYLQNCTVILVARTTKKLEFHADQISQLTVPSTHTAKATYFTCDAASYGNCEELWKNVAAGGYEPDIIMCCAGSSVPKLFADLTAADLQLGMDVNYKTAINVVHAGFKHMMAVNHQIRPQEWTKRNVVLFSSVVGLFPFIGYAQYGPMKSAVDSLSLILRQELKPYNFRVSCVYPGNFLSEGYEEEQKTKPAITREIEGSSPAISGEECASIVLDQLQKGYDSITTDFIGWVLSCSVLGTRPRQWGLIQVVVGLIFSIIEPIVSWTIQRDISKSVK